MCLISAPNTFLSITVTTINLVVYQKGKKKTFRIEMYFPYILVNHYANITLKMDTSWNSDPYTWKYGFLKFVHFSLNSVLTRQISLKSSPTSDVNLVTFSLLGQLVTWSLQPKKLKSETVSYYGFPTAVLDSLLSPFIPSQPQFHLSPNVSGGSTKLYLSSALTPAGLITSASSAILLILTVQSYGY